MKKTALLAAFALTVLVSCNQKQTTTETTETQPMETTHTAIEVKLADLASAKDLYCGMDIVEGSIADTASYEGKLYAFCASECKAEFLKNPQQYLSTK